MACYMTVLHTMVIIRYYIGFYHCYEPLAQFLLACLTPCIAPVHVQLDSFIT